MGNLQTATSCREESTFPAPAEPIFGDLKRKKLPNWSGDQWDNLPTEDNHSESIQVPKHAIATPLKKLRGNFRLLQMWEGRVLDIDFEDQEFSVIISDKTNKDFPDEKVSLSIEEVPPNDLHLLQEGAVFYWSIGYADYPGRPRTRESRIRFRRLPKWTNRELKNAKEIGVQLAGIFSSN